MKGMRLERQPLVATSVAATSRSSARTERAKAAPKPPVKVTPARKKAPAKVVTKKRVPQASKVPTMHAETRRTTKAAPKLVVESPAPPPAPSVVIGQATPRVKSVVDDRLLGFGTGPSR